MLPPFLAPYAKCVTAAVSLLIAWGMLVTTSASGPVTASEWMVLGIKAAAAFGVYAVPNAER